jgi:hypothetical protein
MIRTDASGTRTSFPSNHYAAKQCTDPVSGNVHGNLCLEEVQFSWTEDSLGPPASGQKRKRPGLQNVFHGTRAVWDRMHAARLNLMQGNTDILDDDSRSLHCRIPSFAGTKLLQPHVIFSLPLQLRQALLLPMGMLLMVMLLIQPIMLILLLMKVLLLPTSLLLLVLG